MSTWILGAMKDLADHMNIHMGMWEHIHLFIYLSHAHRLSHVCTHTTHKHTHITRMNSEHTSTSHAWTHTIHTHIPHTMHTNMFIIYAVPHHTSHMYTHNTRIHPCTHTCHMHIPWQNAHIPHMYHIHTNYTHKYFPLQHTCIDTHTHTHMETERENECQGTLGLYVYTLVGMCAHACMLEWEMFVWVSSLYVYGKCVHFVKVCVCGMSLSLSLSIYIYIHIFCLNPGVDTYGSIYVVKV